MNEDVKMWSLYKHTFPNGKIYIGITSVPVKARWDNGYGYSTQPLIFNAIRKYRWENIKHEVLFTNLLEAEAKQKEQELIEFYHSYYLDPLGPGYNMTRGGDGGRTIDVKQVEELYNKGLNCVEIAQKLNCYCESVRKILHNLGYKVWRAKRSVNQYDIEGNYIKTYAILHNKLKSIKGYRWTLYDGTIIKKIPPLDNIPKGRRGCPNNKITNDSPVCQYDLYGNLIKVYSNLIEAGKENNIDITHIKKALNKPNGTCRKTYWKMYDENENNSIYIIDKNNYIRYKPILQYDLTHKFIKAYPTVSAAAAALGTTTSNICSAIKGRMETCCGYYWEYYEQKI